MEYNGNQLVRDAQRGGCEAGMAGPKPASSPETRSDGFVPLAEERDEADAPFVNAWHALRSTVNVPTWLLALLVAWAIMLTARQELMSQGMHTLRATTASAVQDVPCTEVTTGTIVFDSVDRIFKGCDGNVWSQLAFCCAPDQPEPPRLWIDPPDELRDCPVALRWDAPVAHGSPVSEYILRVTRGPPSLPAGSDSVRRTTSGQTAADSSIVYRGERLGGCVSGLDPHSSHWFTLTAHAVGGDSLPSEPVELLPAPAPTSLVAVEADGEVPCQLSAGDALLIGFDRPTNCPGGSGANHSIVPSAEVERLLSFSIAVGPMHGRWVRNDLLELRPLASEAGGGNGVRESDPFMQGLRVTTRAQGGVQVLAPAISLPASGTSPPVEVRVLFARPRDALVRRWMACGKPEAWLSSPAPRPFAGRNAPA